MIIPYDYQKRVNRALRRGRNVILIIPTGMGKTRAASLPFFQSQAREDGLLPAKAIYVVPMRVLATQFQTTCKALYEEELNPEQFLEIEARYRHFRRELISIQTGESPEDPQFESMVTACTIDQLLASALGIPYGLDTRKANLNVGAVSSSYLILDEPHLYPVAEDGRSYKGAFTTCLELLRLLNGLMRFVFMTATMSKERVKRLSILLDAEIILVMKSFSKIRRELKDKNNAEKAQKAREKKEYPMQPTIAYREYVKYQGSLRLACQLPDESVLSEYLPDALMQINYLGKRGGFLQIMERPSTDQHQPEGDFVHLTATTLQAFSPMGTLQMLDDCGPSLTFAKANIYHDAKIVLHKDRVLRHIVLPYEHIRSSRNYSWYQHI